jgi:hypothetical protein
MSIKVSEPVIITPRGLPGVRAGTAYVSVEYGERPNQFDWYVDLDCGQSYSGATPPAPVRYGTVKLQAALGSILYAMAQSAFPEEGIVNLMRFPFGVTRWATLEHGKLMDVINAMNNAFRAKTVLIEEPQAVEPSGAVADPCHRAPLDCE